MLKHYIFKYGVATRIVACQESPGDGATLLTAEMLAQLTTKELDQFTRGIMNIPDMGKSKDKTKATERFNKALGTLQEFVPPKQTVKIEEMPPPPRVEKERDERTPKNPAGKKPPINYRRTYAFIWVPGESSITKMPDCYLAIQREIIGSDFHKSETALRVEILGGELKPVCDRLQSEGVLKTTQDPFLTVPFYAKRAVEARLLEILQPKEETTIVPPEVFEAACQSLSKPKEVPTEPAAPPEEPGLEDQTQADAMVSEGSPVAQAC